MAVKLSRQRSAHGKAAVALTVTALLAACTRPSEVRSPIAPSLPPPAQIMVVGVPTKRLGPDHTPEMKEKADKAALAAAVQLLSTERECGAQWFGDGACDQTFFRPFAEDYQANYSLEKDLARDSSRSDSLPRLGGPGVSVESLAMRLSLACEERCRSSRMASIHTATEEAGRACSAASRGYGACEELGKKVAHTLPEREADLAQGSCEGQCDGARARAAHMAKVNARRPRTKAQAAACEAECNRLHGGDWCGTPLFGCLADCSPTPTLP